MPNTAVIAPALHHVNLKTTQLQTMVDWYGAVVGSKPTFQFPGGAWLTNDGANHRIALLALPGYEDDPNKDRHTGLHHTAYRVRLVRGSDGFLRAPARQGHHTGSLSRSRHDGFDVLSRSGPKPGRAAGRRIRCMGEVEALDGDLAGNSPRIRSVSISIPTRCWPRIVPALVLKTFIVA